MLVHICLREPRSVSLPAGVSRAVYASLTIEGARSPVQTRGGHPWICFLPKLGAAASTVSPVLLSGEGDVATFPPRHLLPGASPGRCCGPAVVGVVVALGGKELRAPGADHR